MQRNAEVGLFTKPSSLDQTLEKVRLISTGITPQQAAGNYQVKSRESIFLRPKLSDLQVYRRYKEDVVSL